MPLALDLERGTDSGPGSNVSNPPSGDRGSNIAPKQQPDFNEGANALWSLYEDEAKSHDAARIETLKKDMDGVLLFSGLFAATITPFILDSRQALHATPSQTMANFQQQTIVILMRIEQQFASIAQNVSFPSALPPTPQIPFPDSSPSSSDVRVNAFWSMSLVFSLSAALIATLVQQWVRYHMQVFRFGHPLKSARLRQYLYDGLEGSRMLVVAQAVPFLIHVSLFLFFLGLCDSLFHLNMKVFHATVVPIAFCGSFYLFSTIAPVMKPQWPYQNPLSGLFWYLIPRRKVLGRGPGGEPKPVSSDMAQGQMQLAMENTDGRLDRDKRGIQWLFSNVTEDTEMESFALAIPGSFDEEWGQKVWEDVFKTDDEGDNPTPGHPPSDTIYDVLCQRIGHLLDTCANRGGLFASEDARLKRIGACINVVALLIFKVRAKLNMFGEIGELLGELGLADTFSASAASPAGGTHSLLTTRWTCVSLVAIRQMLKGDLLSQLAQYAVSGLARFQSRFGSSDEEALASAEAIDRRLEGAWNHVEELDRAFESLDPSRPISLAQVQEILATHELQLRASVAGLEGIGDETDDNENVDWRISLLQDAMDKATHNLTRQLPGVSFNESRRTEPALVSEAFIFHSIGTFPLLPQLVFPLQQLRSLHTLGRKFRNIIDGPHTGGHEAALRSLKSINQIPVQLRRLKDPMKRQLWRLRDLHNGNGLGYTVELFFLALRQLKANDEYYEQTFKDIISQWEDSKDSFGTHQILLNLICDLVIQDRGIFSNYTYPDYITTSLLGLTVDILDGYQHGLGHVEAALRDLQDVPRQQCFDKDFQGKALNALNRLRGNDAINQDEGHVPAT